MSNALIVVDPTEVQYEAPPVPSAWVHVVTTPRGLMFATDAPAENPDTISKSGDPAGTAADRYGIIGRFKFCHNCTQGVYAYSDSAPMRRARQPYREIIARQVDLINDLKTRLSVWGGSGGATAAVSGEIADLKNKLLAATKAKNELEAALRVERDAASDEAAGLADRVQELTEQLNLSTTARHQMAAEVAAAKRAASQVEMEKALLIEDVAAERNNAEKATRMRERLEADFKTLQSRALYERDEVLSRLSESESKLAEALLQRDQAKAAAQKQAEADAKIAAAHADEMSAVQRELEEVNGRLLQQVEQEACRRQDDVAARLRLEEKLRTTIASANADQERFAATISHHGREVDALKADIVDLRVALQEAQGETRELRDKLEDARASKNAAMQGAVEAVSASWEAQECVLETRVRTLQNEVSERQRLHDQACLRLASSREDNAMLFEDKQKTALDLATAQKSLEVSTAEISSLRTTLQEERSKAVQRTRTLWNEAEEARNQVAEASAATVTMQNETRVLKARVAGLEQQLSAERNLAAKAKQEAAAAEKTAKAAKKEAETLAAQLKKASAAQEGLRQHIRTTETTLHEARHAIHERDHELHQLEHDLEYVRQHTVPNHHHHHHSPVEQRVPAQYYNDDYPNLEQAADLAHLEDGNNGFAEQPVNPLPALDIDESVDPEFPDPDEGLPHDPELPLHTMPIHGSHQSSGALHPAYGNVPPHAFGSMMRQEQWGYNNDFSSFSSRGFGSFLHPSMMGTVIPA